MFKFCKYICTKEFWILGKNESGMAPMSHTNMLRRSEMEMFFLNNRIEMEGEQQIFLTFDLKDTTVFMLLHSIFYMGWFLERKCYENCKPK